MNRDLEVSRFASNADDQIDLILVDVIDQISAKMKAGETVDLDAVLAQHPECADRLRKLLPTLEVLADLSESTPNWAASGHIVSSGSANVDASSTAPGVLGDYRILREVGRGGMGVVYEAEQLSLKRRVALKVLPFAAVLDPRRLQRFRNEAQAAASLRHPHIVQVFAIGCERGVHYYAMDFIEGQTVAQAIADLGQPKNAQNPTAIADSSTQARRSNSRPSASSLGDVVSSAASVRSPEFLRTVARLGIQAAEALEHAHRLGIVHRDIKPSNLLLDEQGQLFVTDFGLAMTTSDANLTMSGDLLGTVRYMSPEQVQARHQVMDHRTDIYSLGVTLYEMLTLQPVFGTADRQQLMREIVEDDPVKPRQLNAAIPRDLETVVLKAIAKEPHARYATAEDMARDLQRFLNDVPIHARRPSLIERTKKWARRHRVFVRAGLAVLAIVACVLVGLGRSHAERQMAIQQQVAVARALIETRDYGAAQRELAEARAHLETLFWQPASLSDHIASLSRKLEAKTEAQDRFAQFQECRQRVHANVYTTTPDAVSKSRDVCHQALALYDVFGDTELEDQAAFAFLAQPDQERLRKDMGELLFILATGELNRVQDAEAVSRAYGEAIDVLQRIERVYRPLPAIQLWLATAYQHQGDEPAADAARERGQQRADDALDDFIRGEYEFYCAQDPLAALDEYNRALLRQPDHYLSLLASGLTLRKLGRWDAAQAMLTGAIAANPESLIARLRRADTFIHQEKLEPARVDLQEAERLAPNDYSIYLSWHWYDNVRQEPEHALEMLSRAEELGGASRPEVFYWKGRIFTQLRQDEQAIEAFSRAIELLQSRPESATTVPRGNHVWLPQEWIIDLFTRRGLLNRTLERHDEATADLRGAIACTPTSAAGYESLGVACTALGEYEMAADAFRRAIHDDPSEELVEHAWLAHAYLALAEWDQAIDCFNRQVEIFPLESIHYRFRALAHLRNGDLAAASRDADRAVELAPDAAENRLMRARVRWEQGDPKRAREDIEEAIQIDPRYTLAYCYRSLSLAHDGQLQAARDDLEQTREIRYESPTHSMLNALHTDEVAWFLVTCPDARLWNPPRALQLAQQLVSRKSNQRLFWTTLGAAQYRTGDYEAARENLEKMVALRQIRRGHAALFLAMTCHQLGDDPQARHWYELGLQWIAGRSGVLNEDRHLCLEAAQLIGIEDAQHPNEP